MTSTATITAGTFLKNSSPYLFLVTEINEARVKLERYTPAGSTGSTSTLSRAAFDGLWKNKNFRTAKVIYSTKENRWKERTDALADRLIGAHRYLVVNR